MDRAACERRVYRLATLLTGNPKLATGVITAVVDAQPDVSRLDGPHMDRLTVLRSREIRSGVLHVAPDVPRGVSEALADLPEQQREAWVFARVYRMDLREMARAMDCSTSATAMHLQLADQVMAERLGVAAAAEAPAQLLAFTLDLDVPAFYRSARRTRKTVKWIVILVGIIVILVAVFVSARWLAIWASDTLSAVEHGAAGETHPEN